MMGGVRKVLVGGGRAVEVVQLGAGEEGLGEARKRTMVSQVASAPVPGIDDRGEVDDA